MPFELEPQHRNIPDADLLVDIQRVAKAVGNGKLTWAAYSRAGLSAGKRWRIGKILAADPEGNASSRRPCIGGSTRDNDSLMLGLRHQPA